jgi:hypothetical protein
VKAKDAQLSAQTELILSQKQRITSLESDSNSILKQPVVWFIVGVLSASLTVFLVKQ